VANTRTEYHDLSAIYLPIAAAVFAVVVLTTLYFAVRYRRRAGRPGRPGARHDAPVLEVLYVLALVAVAVFLIGATFTREAKIDPVRAHPGLVVDVTAAKWRWTFAYPRYAITRTGGQVGSLERPAVLVVPTGTRVEFVMHSLDVIHSFWIPALRFKRDAFPRATTRFDLVFDQPGFHSATCAEFCGLHHAEMGFRVEALSPGDFAAWARSGGRAG
jgi:cytochrome c oxidase subunit 2